MNWIHDSKKKILMCTIFNKLTRRYGYDLIKLWQKHYDNRSEEYCKYIEGNNNFSESPCGGDNPELRKNPIQGLDHFYDNECNDDNVFEYNFNL